MKPDYKMLTEMAKAIMMKEVEKYFTTEIRFVTDKVGFQMSLICRPIVPNGNMMAKSMYMTVANFKKFKTAQKFIAEGTYELMWSLLNPEEK